MALRPRYNSLDTSALKPVTAAKARGLYDIPAAERRTRARTIELYPTQWVSEFIQLVDGDTGRVVPIEFSERKYLERPYNTSAKKILLLTSRQTEKCGVVSQRVSMANGRLVPMGDVVVGDELLSLEDTQRIAGRRVTWVSPVVRKPAVRITTARGHVLEVAATHPIRTWESWTEAGKLRARDRVAALVGGGDFTADTQESKERIRLTAYLIGDGCTTQPPSVSFSTDKRGPWAQEVINDVTALGGSYRTYASGANGLSVRINKLGVLLGWLEGDGLLNTHGNKKFVPGWVFGLDRADTSLFLNRLWATDGHCSRRSSCLYEISYCSMSRRLVEDVQALLWKFGIPSGIRENWPAVYKKRGIKRVAYILTVKTQEGVRRFLRDIGALGKSESLPPPEAEERNNRDTFPKAGVQELLDSLPEAPLAGGMSRRLSYAPGRPKMLRYAAAARELGQEDLAEQLEKHARGDVFWDVITSVEDIGEQDCVDFTVETTHNFVASGVVTHNSTTVGNKLLSLSNMRSRYISLFVSPSAMQTMVFSKTRIDEIVEMSPMLKALTHRSLVWNLLEKTWLNGSKMYLRYAFLNADRIRGLSVNAIFADEIQDLLADVMPVIEETSSHFKDRLFVYSGTPKTFDNTINSYWEDSSTQAEWVIPCEHHGTPNRPATWHWNVLGVDNIGDQGPICDRCGSPINPEHGSARWVEMNPGAEFQGFRICRLMVPWYFKNPDQWAGIVEAQKRYPVPRFMNEVMALSYDSGTKPLTRGDVITACDDKYDMSETQLRDLRNSHILYAGLDWGSGTEGNAYTVVTFGGYTRHDTSYQIVYAKRLEGRLAEPTEQLKEIFRLFGIARPARVGSDYGMGLFQNNILTKKLGPKRVHVFMYAPRYRAKVAFEPKLGRFVVYRSLVMSDVFTAIKQLKIRLPSYTVFADPYAKDFLNITSSYSNTQRITVYDKPRNRTDDTFHSSTYSLLASVLDTPRPDIFAPIKEETEQERWSHEEAEAISYLQDFMPEHGLEEFE